MYKCYIILNLEIPIRHTVYIKDFFLIIKSYHEKKYIDFKFTILCFYLIYQSLPNSCSESQEVVLFLTQFIYILILNQFFYIHLNNN